MAKPPRHPGRWLYDQPHLLLSLATLFWAGNFVLGRYVVGIVPPVALAFIRWIGAAMIVLPFAMPHLRRDWPALRNGMPLMLVLSLLGISAFNTMAYFALQYTEAINGVLMQSAAPLLIGIWSYLIFRDPLSPGQIFAILISLAGVATIVTRGDVSAILALRFNVGDLWILAAMALYALYATLLRRRPDVHPLTFLGFTMAVGGLMLTPIFLVEIATGHVLRANLTTVLALLYVIVFPSVLSYLCFNRGVELLGANRAGPFFHLVPLFGSALAIMFLGEVPAPYHLAGYALILGGIVLSQRR